MDSNSIPGRFELWSGFLSMLQVFYTSDAARESFVELCEEEYVQKAGRQVLPFSTSVLSFKHGERKENQKRGKV